MPDEPDNAKTPSTPRRPIAPLCTIHNTLMKDLRCTEPGCTRVYTPSAGYFDGDDAAPPEKDIVFCPADDCGSPMYLESIFRNGREIWRCPREYCGRKVRR